MTSAAATSIAGASAAPSSHRARRGGDARNPRRTPHPRLVRWTARTAPIDDDGDDDASALAPPRASSPSPSPSPSSWDAEETHARGTGEDYLYELGRQSSNLRTEVGARKGVVDDVFAGTANANFVLGADADIATGELRYTEARSLTNVVDGCYVPPRFMDKVCVHLVKNHLAEGVGQVPLILGIWGEKGCGKSYTLELCLRAMRASPIIVSAGELEDEWAGAPGRRIRERYRAASRLMSQARSISTLTGRLACLVINDLDAGAGTYRATQKTVNMQMVMGTLMNLCDHPTSVSVGAEEWREDRELRRVPIIITGNDLSTLYAPLLRDGRMDKFMWAPSIDERAAAVHAVMADAGVTARDALELVRAFSNQARSPLDFFGALHARTVDAAVLEWIARNGGARGMGDALLRGDARTRKAPSVDRSSSRLTLEALLEIGRELEREQQRVLDVRLVDEYMKGVKEDGVRESDERDSDVAARSQVRSIHWFPYDRVGVVNADP
ncbi:uncharacterized protein MICPUCDRAFT_18274 [Micromonas pusilla CCMP1545]|uniref:Ribulose bisphosphate carboxylase/oxygenase activase, chloroplastic n=1 Tax=Micromonas pusilla (strain CCMP1545) TaxID=564608 RepID=C1MW61_MICPC|nr:uncharacterized protein MICPUCDRAFT_18274 [Micromonas pusilla CCMP1545]EEH56113.1 predicted protein [Micromonas pusilla CCMP1545]|eukprot:XP_003060161.1 predicted protein [Micromonas pusilla CCMP1545]